LRLKISRLPVKNGCQFLELLSLVRWIFPFLFSYVFISFEGVYLPVPGWIVRSKQLFDQEEVDVVHPLDKEKGITLEDFKLIKMHMVIRTPFCLSFLILFNIIMFTIEFVSYSVRFHLGNLDFSWLMRL
jgi:hypothetical protein